jgi:hypothetical protein
VTVHVKAADAKTQADVSVHPMAVPCESV